ncbi:unnamed protein product [Parajaminaea phylloscopi]
MPEKAVGAGLLDGSQGLQAHKAPRSALDEEEAFKESRQAPQALASQHSPTYTAAATFLAAGAGNILSACATNGFDVIKVRQQMILDRQRASFLTVGRSMLAKEGILSLWAGVTASCIREGTYSTVRLGGYEPAKRFYADVIGMPQSSFSNKLMAGITSGAVGAAFSTPTDLLKVRMQAARPDGRPPFRTTFHGFAELYRQGGLRSLYRGLYPNTIRAAILTSSQIATYDEVKGWFKTKLGMEEGIKLHFSASMVAGFVCSAASSPVDVVKVRIMSTSAKTGESSLTLLSSLLRQEGPLALWKGFGMCWARLGTHTVISLSLFEAFRRALGIQPL